MPVLDDVDEMRADDAMLGVRPRFVVKFCVFNLFRLFSLFSLSLTDQYTNQHMSNPQNPNRTTKNPTPSNHPHHQSTHTHTHQPNNHARTRHLALGRVCACVLRHAHVSDSELRPSRPQRLCVLLTGWPLACSPEMLAFLQPYVCFLIFLFLLNTRAPHIPTTTQHPPPLKTPNQPQPQTITFKPIDYLPPTAQNSPKPTNSTTCSSTNPFLAHTPAIARRNTPPTTSSKPPPRQRSPTPSPTGRCSAAKDAAVSGAGATGVLGRGGHLHGGGGHARGIRCRRGRPAAADARLCGRRRGVSEHTREIIRRFCVCVCAGGTTGAPNH